jgi:hypothetical protein
MQKDYSFRLQQFVDPWFGSERFVSFEADWIESAVDDSKWLIFRPRTPVTRLRFRTGENYTVHGHWAEAISRAKADKAAEAQRHATKSS